MILKKLLFFVVSMIYTSAANFVNSSLQFHTMQKSRTQRQLVEKQEYRNFGMQYRISNRSSSCRIVRILRGGSDSDVDTKDEVEEMEEEDFEEAAVQNRVLKLWQRTPYLTKHFFYISFGLTLYSFALNGNHWPSILELTWERVLKGQIWRLFAAFFCFGPLGLNCLISMYFVWTYMGELERMYFKRPHDFAMMLGYGAICLLATTSVLGINGQFLGHSLSCYLVYIWSREYEGVEVNVNDMFNLKAELLPWFFVAQTLVLEGQMPLLDLVGIFVGYLYMQLKIRKMIKAPQALVNFFKIPSIAKDYNRFEKEFGVENLSLDEAQEDTDSESDESSQESEENLTEQNDS